ncbi:MAG: LD-carboxypeptidase [Clostridia bacterium]|nr:LD-carboxypeptidase [Clostridia bacterium]
MIYPKFIKENNCIGIPAPSAGAKDEKKINKYKNAQKRLESLDYNLELSKNLYNDIKGRSASAEERGKEINEMFSDDNIDLILCAAGGDFLVEMLPYVDFETLKQNPKYVVGFSDPTGLLYTITSKYDIATIYGQNFSHLGIEPLTKTQKDFLEIIKGNIVEQESFELYEGEYEESITGLEPPHLTKPVYWKTLDGKEAKIDGRIIGGCFDIISELAGTKYDGINEFNEKYKDDGIIWYFDNCEITMEETIRVLWKFNELGYFKYCKGIIFGRFGVDTTYYNYDTETCLKDSVISELNIPIIYDADFSHKAPCLNVINGAIAKIKVKDGKGKINFDLR